MAIVVFAQLGCNWKSCSVFPSSALLSECSSCDMNTDRSQGKNSWHLLPFQPQASMASEYALGHKSRQKRPKKQNGGVVQKAHFPPSWLPALASVPLPVHPLQWTGVNIRCWPAPPLTLALCLMAVCLLPFRKVDLIFHSNQVRRRWYC